VTPAQADIRPGRPAIRPTWPRVLVIVLLLGLAFVASRSCQQSQIRLTKEQAITKAEREVDFSPTRTQVRLLRQGLGSKPFWIVSLSIPAEVGTGQERLAVVRIDANTGEVADVREGRNVPEGQRLRERSSDGG
jgi:Peptidase propeptide and YPEB domain